jgi:hypothetical protein
MFDSRSGVVQECSARRGSKKSSRQVLPAVVVPGRIRGAAEDDDEAEGGRHHQERAAWARRAAGLHRMRIPARWSALIAMTASLRHARGA